MSLMVLFSSVREVDSALAIMASVSVSITTTMTRMASCCRRCRPQSGARDPSCVVSRVDAWDGGSLLCCGAGVACGAWVWLVLWVVVLRVCSRLCVSCRSNVR